MIEPNKYDIQTASILIDTAKAELDRKIIAELPEQTKRLAFYQGFCDSTTISSKAGGCGWQLFPLL